MPKITNKFYSYNLSNMSEDSSSDSDSYSDSLGSPLFSPRSPYSSDDDCSIDEENVRINEIKNFFDTPNRCLKATAARELANKIYENALMDCEGTTRREKCFNLHTKISVEKDSSLSWKLIDLHEIYHNSKHKPDDNIPPKAVINLRHIILNENGGYHCIIGLNNIPMEKFTNVIFATNGIFQATFKQQNGTGKEKTSTFFPKSISNENQLLEIIHTATPIARKDNRILPP